MKRTCSASPRAWRPPVRRWECDARFQTPRSRLAKPRRRASGADSVRGRPGERNPDAQTLGPCAARPQEGFFDGEAAKGAGYEVERRRTKNRCAQLTRLDAVLQKNAAVRLRPNSRVQLHSRDLHYSYGQRIKQPGQQEVILRGALVTPALI